MGGTILEAVIKTGGHSVSVYDPSPDVRERFASFQGVTFCESESEAAAGADLAVVAVKPVVIRSLLDNVENVIKGSSTIVLSVAAGVKMHEFVRRFGPDHPVVRAMPNLPALVGSGFTGLYFNEKASRDPRKNIIEDIFGKIGGIRLCCNEYEIDKMIPVTSSSPAYVCLLIEAMADGAVRLGFRRDEAYKMCAQAVLGTADYILKTNIHPGALKDMICSPQGTTIEAVAALERDGFRAAVLDAMDKCFDKLNQ